MVVQGILAQLTVDRLVDTDWGSSCMIVVSRSIGHVVEAAGTPYGLGVASCWRMVSLIHCWGISFVLVWALLLVLVVPGRPCFH